MGAVLATAAMVLSVIAAVVSVWMLFVTNWYTTQARMWSGDYAAALARQDSKPWFIRWFDRLEARLSRA